MAVKFKPKRRSRLEIIADVLRQCETPTPAEFLMDMAARTNSDLWRGYIRLLTSRELLRAIDADKAKFNSRIVYQTTAKGQLFLKHFDVMVSLLE